MCICVFVCVKERVGGQKESKDKYEATNAFLWGGDENTVPGLRVTINNNNNNINDYTWSKMKIIKKFRCVVEMWNSLVDDIEGKLKTKKTET